MTRPAARTSAILLIAIMLINADVSLAANGATAVDDADVAAPGACKVESWAAFGESGDFIGTVAAACVLPAIRPIEVTIQGQRNGIGGHWDSAGSAKAKVNLIAGPIGVGLAGGVGFDPFAREHTGSFAYVPVSLQVNETFKLNVNAGWSHEHANSVHWLTWGAGFEWNVVKPVTVMAEIFGQTAGNPFNIATAVTPRAQAGLRFTPVDHIDVDVLYGRNITGEGRNWVTLGLNYRFDVPLLQRR